MAYTTVWDSETCRTHKHNLGIAWKFWPKFSLSVSAELPSGHFDVDLTLNRCRNFNGRRKGVEKRKNISTVIEKALKFRQSLKFRYRFDVELTSIFQRFHNLFGVEKALKIWHQNLPAGYISYKYHAGITKRTFNTQSKVVQNYSICTKIVSATIT